MSETKVFHMWHTPAQHVAYKTLKWHLRSTWARQRDACLFCSQWNYPSAVWTPDIPNWTTSRSIRAHKVLNVYFGLHRRCTQALTAHQASTAFIWADIMWRSCSAATLGANNLKVPLSRERPRRAHICEAVKLTSITMFSRGTYCIFR